MAIINLLQHTTYVYDHVSFLQRHFLCPISALKMCTFLLFDTLSLLINGSLVKKIGRQTTLPKLLRRGDARRPLSGRFAQAISGTSSRCATLETRTVLHYMNGPTAMWGLERCYCRMLRISETPRGCPVSPKQDIADKPLCEPHKGARSKFFY